MLEAFQPRRPNEETTSYLPATIAAECYGSTNRGIQPGLLSLAQTTNLKGTRDVGQLPVLDIEARPRRRSPLTSPGSNPLLIDDQGPDTPGVNQTVGGDNQAVFLCCLDGEPVQDGGDRIQPVNEAARPLLEQMQRLLRSVVPAIDVEALSEIARLMQPQQRDQLIALLRPLITGNGPNGQPRFDETQRAELTRALDGGEIPQQLLAHSPQARERIQRFIRESLDQELQRHEAGPLTRAMHQSTINWLGRETQDLLRVWANTSTDLPPAGCPLRIPPGVQWQDVLTRLRESSDPSRQYISQLLRDSPFAASIDWQQLSGATGRERLQHQTDALADALRWRGSTMPVIERLLQESLGNETRNNLAWLARQGIVRPEWAPRPGGDRQSWYAAAGLRGDQTKLATNIIQIILAMRAMPGGADYPPARPGEQQRRDPFGPGFPGTVTRRQDGSLDVRLNVPSTLDPTPENELFWRNLQTWINNHKFVIDDFMRMFHDAERQFGILCFADLPISGRAENGALYNLARPRFQTRREGQGENAVTVVTQRTYYYNSPWYNPHDLFGGAVYVDPPEGQPAREIRVRDNQLVPVMTNNGLVLVRGQDLSSFSSDPGSSAWWQHHGSRAVAIGFDVAMCATAVTRAGYGLTALFRAGAGAVEREAAWLALRQGAYNALLGGSSFLTSSWWQNRDLPLPLRILPDARTAWFVFDMARNLPGALRTIGGAVPLVRRMPWIAGAAGDATSVASNLERMIGASRWGALDGGTRLTATAAEVGLLSMVCFGGSHMSNGFAPADIIQFANQGNLEQSTQAYLARVVSNLSRGQRVPNLDAVVEAVRRYRPNMPAQDRDTILSDLSRTIDNAQAQPRERITAAIALFLVLNREQQDGNHELSNAQKQQLDKAREVLTALISTQLSPSDRLACGQGLLLTGQISPHAYANLCRQVARDGNAPQEVRQQAVFGMGVCLMLTRDMEKGLHDNAQRSAYLAGALNATSLDLEQDLIGLAGGQHNASDDMRVAAVSLLHALNRDDSNQAQQMIGDMLNWYDRNHGQPGDFARHFAGRLLGDLHASPPALPAQQTADNMRAYYDNLRKYYENRLTSGSALRLLSGDAALMTRLNCQLSTNQINEELIGVARGAVRNPEVATQAILALSNADGLTQQQITQLCQATDRLLRMPVLNPEQALAVTIMKEALLSALPNLLKHAPQAERTRLLETISGFIDPSRSGTAGADGQFAGDSADLRVAAIKTLSELHAQKPLPNSIIVLIAGRAGYTPGQQGGRPSPNDASARVRQVAFEALKLMGYGARADAHVDLDAIARTWQTNDPDLALRMMAGNWLQISAQQRLPSRQAITDAGAADANIPRVSSPISINANETRQWLNRHFRALLVTATNPDGSIDGERQGVDPIEELLNAFDLRRPDRFGVIPDINGRFRNTPGIVVNPAHANRVRGAMASYINDLNKLMIAAQGTGPDSQQARQAVFWIAQGGWQEFPARFRDAVAIMSVHVIEGLARGQNSAQARLWLESLLESNQASPEARLIALNGLRTIRDGASMDSYQGRYTALLESVFSQLVTQRPDQATPQGQRHYTLLQEVMADLAFKSQLRSPFFLSRLQAMAGDNSLPVDVRRFANMCRGRLLAWSNAALFTDRPNNAGATPQARVQHLEQALRDPGRGDLKLIEAIFDSVRGLPMQNNDPRLPLLMSLIWNPSENNLRAQLAACRAAFMITSNNGIDNDTTAQIGQVQRLALLRLAQIAEFGPRQSNDTSWTFQDEARSILSEFVFMAAPGDRTARQALVDTSTTRARAMRTGVAAVMAEVRQMLSSPLGQSLLGNGGAVENGLRMQNLAAIAQHSDRLTDLDTVSLLVQSLSDYRNGQFGPWTPMTTQAGQTVRDQQMFAQMEQHLTSIMQNQQMDRRVPLAAAIHVLTNPTLFSQALKNRALDAIVRLSNQQVQANPLWRQEAQHYVNMILTRPNMAGYRAYITEPGRAPELQPVQR